MAAICRPRIPTPTRCRLPPCCPRISENELSAFSSWLSASGRMGGRLSPWSGAVTLVILVAVLLAVLGAPLFSILAFIGISGFMLSGQDVWNSIGNVYRLAQAEAVSLSTIPLFTFAGYLMAQAKTAQRLIRMAEAIMGWVPGGLALVTLWICAFFTTFTGASGVTIVAVGGLILPALLKSRYGQRFSLEVVTGSGAVGLLFPPSLPLIVYGIIYGLNSAHLENKKPFSIEKFLFAGIVPGLILLGILS